MSNTIRDLLFRLGLCSEDSLRPYMPRVRDRDDVAALRCNTSGVVILTRTDHMDIQYYENKEDFVYWKAKDRKSALIAVHDDTRRRADCFRSYVRNRVWLDVGTGTGGILDELAGFAARAVAIEPQNAARNVLMENGYEVYASIFDIGNQEFDVVTLFHVLEHLTDPIGVLRELQEKMKVGGRIIIEVPHARDFLLEFFELKSFKEFTLWSEHLILHTRQSLTAFLVDAGFKNVTISGIQRYPLANHLYWLAKNRPGGHEIWSHLRTSALDHEYANLLSILDCNDTLIAVAEK